MKKNICWCDDLSLDTLGRTVIQNEKLIEKINGAVSSPKSSGNFFDFQCPDTSCPDTGCTSTCFNTQCGCEFGCVSFE